MNRSTVRPMKIAAFSLAAGLLLAATGCPNQAHNESVTAANAGSKAAGAKQYDTAIAEYKKATEKYHDNHLAWYGLGGALAAQSQWSASSDAFSTAVQLVPEQPMYNMWYGIALYEKAVQGAREDQARKENKKPEEITPDLTAVNFQTPLQYLTQAVKLNADMWRAHYYLGRIYREMDKPKDAADEFSKALVANPRESGPYIALGELYNKWDYTDQAIAVSQKGTTFVPGSNEVADIWYELGMGYSNKSMDKEAIDAFTKAIESRKDQHKAKFQRGQAYFHRGDFTDAKRDLEEFSKSAGASVEFAKQQASKMLMDIAAKAAGQAPPTGGPVSPEQLVNGKPGTPPKKKGGK